MKFKIFVNISYILYEVFILFYLLHTGHLNFLQQLFDILIFHSSLPHERPNGFSFCHNKLH